VAHWTSPPIEPGFDLTELVASWNADAPAGTWIEVRACGLLPTGEHSAPYVLGRWASEDGDGFHRTSVAGQRDGHAEVRADTLATVGEQGFTGWQLGVSLHRPAGSTATPEVSLLGAFASRLPAEPAPPGPPGDAGGVVLDVPAYSQELHVGRPPQQHRAGEAWCSPTSTAMVLDYWRVGPGRAETAWAEPAEDPQVDHAAWCVYDHAHGGTGNAPFNTAYAAGRGLRAFVTRLRSLAEAERFITAGIPLVVSVSFTERDLCGARYASTGHLMVVVGFDEDGDVVVNDPASHRIPSNAEVRTTFDRRQFESVWSHSGRIAYVIHPASTPLPPAPAEPNW